MGGVSESYLDKVIRVALDGCARFGNPAKLVLGDTPIYCISMPASKDRRARVMKSAQKHGLKVAFSPGIATGGNANDTVPTPFSFQSHGIRFVLWDGTVRQPHLLKSYGGVTHGQLGCTTAHALLMRTIAAGNTPYALVIEDDVDFDLVPFWPITLATYVADAPSGWEILQVQCGSPRRIEEGGGRYESNISAGTFAYCVSRAAAKRFWNEHYNLLTNTFMYKSNIKAFPGNVVADWYIYRILNTFHNLEFPALTFSQGTSLVNEESKGGHNVSLAVGQMAVCRVVKTIALKLYSKSGTIKARIYVPGIPQSLVCVISDPIKVKGVGHIGSVKIETVAVTAAQPLRRSKQKTRFGKRHRQFDLN